MPGVYREKECPTCGTKHRKKGPFCSRSCGNGREFTEDQKKNLRAKTREYYQSPEGIATVKKNIAILSGERAPGITEEEWAVSIPDLHDLRDYDEFIENYDRGEKW
jgi:predicted nucleic acid-binding Zn ribbon protein